MNEYNELVARLRAIGERLKFDKTSCVYLAANAIEQLVIERDAALADLRDQRVCEVCKYLNTRIDDDPCYSCMVSLARKPEKGFEWRGVTG